MKLSEVLSSLADQSKKLEERFQKWDEETQAWSKEQEAELQTWSEQVKEQYEANVSKINTFVKENSDEVQAEWKKMGEGWDKQVESLKQGIADFEGQMKQEDVNFEANAREAQAAAAVKYALEVQQEAEIALLKAAEARAKANNNT